MPEISTGTCLECGILFRGRKDKKFCSDHCRIAYNNRINRDETSYVRTINNVLRRNRRILRELNPEGKCRVSYDRLRASGFDFRYFTTIYTNRDGVQYFYCYDQGYRSLGKDAYLLVIKK
ncbi:MAG TPA: hypothetical protein VD816_05260 [Ohtaekwangia sp.]|nr:hypothetical protein [Ohtaekwangia sp.]